MNFFEFSQLLEWPQLDYPQIRMMASFTGVDIVHWHIRDNFKKLYCHEEYHHKPVAEREIYEWALYGTMVMKDDTMQTLAKYFDLDDGGMYAHQGGYGDLARAWEEASDEMKIVTKIIRACESMMNLSYETGEMEYGYLNISLHYREHGLHKTIELFKQKYPYIKPGGDWDNDDGDDNKPRPLQPTPNPSEKKPLYVAT